jgi:hypothetical protein
MGVGGRPGLCRGGRDPVLQSHRPKLGEVSVDPLEDKETCSVVVDLVNCAGSEINTGSFGLYG